VSGVANRFALHDEAAGDIHALASAVFDYIDRPERLSSHMSRRSWRMPGGTMTVETDDGGGRRVGSRIRLAGHVLGMQLDVEDAVVERVPPRRKAWETLGEPQLLVIGPYRMAVDVSRESDVCRVTIAIDYSLPARGPSRWLGRLLGPTYARWCVAQMLMDLRREFA
jgi:hypothetical protein